MENKVAEGSLLRGKLVRLAAANAEVDSEAMAGWSGEKVCTTTRPGLSPRPARPATWVITWKVRSEERKSGKWRPVSALMIPTSVTSGKSCPFAIICVPTRMSCSPRANLPRVSIIACWLVTVSLSSLATRASS